MTQVNVIKDTASPYVRNLNKKLPRATKEDCKKIAGIFRNEYRKNIKHQGLIWTRRLFNQTRAVPVRNGYGVSIPKEGIYLDRMKVHWVSPKYPEIRQWEIDKGIIPPRSIKVRPHPFILAAEARANAKINDALQRGEIIKVLSEGVLK